MHVSLPRGLAIAAAATDADLEDMIVVRAAADPDRPSPRIENLRHNLTAQKGLVFLVARLDGAPVGCGFVYPDLPEYAEAHVVVIPASRRRGVGSALLARVGDRARAAGKRELQGEVRESDRQSRSHLERGGYRTVGGEKALALDLRAIDTPVPTPPPGIRLVSRAERPELVDELYPVGADATEDIPASRAPRTNNGEQPTSTARHATRTSSSSRSRATSRSVTRRSTTWVPMPITVSQPSAGTMRALNEKLGYRPEQSLSTVVLRGPAIGTG